MSDRTAPLGPLSSAPAASAIGAMQNPTKPERPAVDSRLTGRRMLTVALLLPLFMLFIMPLLMTGMTSDVDPRDMQVAVIGTDSDARDLASSLEEQSAGGFEVTTVDSVAEARTQVQEQEIRAAYDPESATVYRAPASGRQVTGAVDQFFGAAAQQAGQSLTTEDLVPLKDGDPSGSASLTVPVLVMLGWLVGGVLLAVAGTVQQKRRHLFAQLSAKEEAETAVAVGAAAV